MAPHLVGWHERWTEKGLVVIHVEDGRATDLEALRQHAATDGIPHPLLHDANGANVARYRVRAVPAAYVLDRRGKVVWEGSPVRDRAGVEAAIARAVGR